MVHKSNFLLLTACVALGGLASASASSSAALQEEHFGRFLKKNKVTKECKEQFKLIKQCKEDHLNERLLKQTSEEKKKKKEEKKKKKQLKKLIKKFKLDLEFEECEEEIVTAYEMGCLPILPEGEIKDCVECHQKCKETGGEEEEQCHLDCDCGPEREILEECKECHEECELIEDEDRREICHENCDCEKPELPFDDIISEECKECFQECKATYDNKEDIKACMENQCTDCELPNKPGHGGDIISEECKECFQECKANSDNKEDMKACMEANCGDCELPNKPGHGGGKPDGKNRRSLRA